MKILTTVGTTAFDSLIKAVDIFFKDRSQDTVFFQIADGVYKPKCGASLQFTDSISNYYVSSDLVITHAGAGSIYTLLELGKKVIAVPNLNRIDKHQVDIANYMESNGFLLVSWSVETIPDVIEKSFNFIPQPYKKEDFFKYEDIANTIRNCVK